MSKQPEGIVRRITRQQWESNWERVFNTPKHSPKKLLSDAAKYKDYMIKKMMEKPCSTSESTTR